MGDQRVQVVALPDPQAALDRAGDFLRARPVEHNLPLTILAQSIEFSLGGAFWVVVDGAEIVGFALQSPPGMPVVITPMPTAASHALADAIAPPVFGVTGEAGAAAAFAGRWTERHAIAGSRVEGMRLYALTDLAPVASAPGRFRLAERDDRSTLVEWTRAFTEEAGDLPRDTEAYVDLRVDREQYFVWDDDGLTSMACASAPEAGVARVGPVYTPPRQRGAGYATACVAELSRVLSDRGLRCVLFTDLANATSNAIYRRIGYRAVTEVLAYKFGGGPGGGPDGGY